MNEAGARFARQLGVEDVVIHLTDYGRDADNADYLAGRAVGPVNGSCIGAEAWTGDRLAGVVSMLAAHGLKVAAMENIAPHLWSDILLDGPRKHEQMEGLKQLVRDAGQVGIPVIGYYFSLAGVWGWQRRPVARGGATTVAFVQDEVDVDSPIPDGMVFNMRYRPAQPGAAPIAVDAETLWARLGWFLRELVPVAEAAGVRLAAHPDDPPVAMLRGTARLVDAHEKYDRLLALAPSRANALEFCVGTLSEMRAGDIYATTRRFARAGAIAYIHFRNVRGRVPHDVEAFVDDGDTDMAEIVRILAEENYDGVLVPDHVPEMDCPAPWHAGHAYTVGYMKALVAAAQRGRRTAPTQPDIAAAAR
ncbi:MAG: mannonate dehydratase [Alphaproteobacteria bacterium]